MGEEFSQGEIQRSLARLEKGLAELTVEVRDRHHRLSNEISAAIGPLSVLKVQMAAVELKLEQQAETIQSQQDTIQEQQDWQSRVNGVLNILKWVGAGGLVALGIAILRLLRVLA